MEVNGGDDIEWYVKALTKGWHIGAVANEDEHQREWSTSADGKTLILTRGTTPTGLLLRVPEPTHDRDPGSARERCAGHARNRADDPLLRRRNERSRPGRDTPRLDDQGRGRAHTARAGCRAAGGEQAGPREQHGGGPGSADPTRCGQWSLARRRSATRPLRRPRARDGTSSPCAPPPRHVAAATGTTRRLPRRSG